MKFAKISLFFALVALATAGVAAPDKVWVSKSGDKYHLSKACPSLKGAKNVHEITMTEARKKKITMCKHCQEAKKGRTKSAPKSPPNSPRKKPS